MSQSDQSVDVHNPPMDNFNTSNYASSASYFHEPTSNGGSYTNQATSLIRNMAQQLHHFVKDNHDLKKSIRSNNQELQQKCRELNNWKEKMIKEKLLLKQKFNQARSAHTALQDGNALLKAENIKLELRLRESGNECDVTSQNSDGEQQGDGIHSKYLATVEKLERQLKEALDSRDTIDKNCERLIGTNRQLQLQHHQRSQAEQMKRRELMIMQENNNRMESQLQSLGQKLHSTEELKHKAETTCKEVQAQNVQLMNDDKAYRAEIESLKSDKALLQNQLKEMSSRVGQLQESLGKARQDLQNLQDERAQETSSLKAQIADKTQSLDELFHVYDKMRVENDKLNADIAQMPDVNELVARLFSAEESLQRKDREMTELQARLREEQRMKDEEIRKLKEDTNFFQAQSDIYKQDFLMEREDRASAHEQNEQLKSRIEQLNGRIEQLSSNRFEAARRQ